MLKYSINIFFIKGLLILLLCSCNENNNNINCPVCFLDTDDKVIRNIRKIDFEQGKYVCVSKNIDKGTYDSIPVKDCKIHGNRKLYFSDTKFTRFLEYENDTLHGLDSGIYNNGVVAVLGEYNKGNKVGGWVFRNKNGVLDKYEYYTSFGKIAYIRKYSNEISYKSEGIKIVELGFFQNKNFTDSILNSKKLQVSANLITPPNCIGKLCFYEIDKKIAKFNGEKDFFLGYIINKAFKSSSFVFDYEFVQSGEVSLIIQYSIEDTLTGKKEDQIVNKKFYINN